MSGATFMALVSGGKIPSLSYRTTAENNTSLTAYTFTAQDIGTATVDRFVVIGIMARKASPTAVISSLTVGGIAAVAVKTQGSTDGDIAALWIAAVPTGATGDVVVNFSSAPIRVRIGVWALAGLNSGTAEATAGSVAAPLNVSLTPSPGAAVIGVAYSASGTSANWTWVGLNEDFDTGITGGPNAAGGASAIAAGGALTITATGSSSSTPAGVAASFR